MFHDQNFKNLILDYPREALTFFAEAEAALLAVEARIVPIRQEQLQERLGAHFHELDVPLLVESPDGRRGAVVFAVEQETEPRNFSLHRLAHYVLHLSEMFETDRVVPVVVFLKAGSYTQSLCLGGNRRSYLHFDFLDFPLAETPYERYRDSNNIVARLNLPNLRYGAEAKLDVYAQALRGLRDLENDPHKQMKYLDFIDIYADLTDNERERFAATYPDEVNTMSRFAERFIQKGREEGREEGWEKGIEAGCQQGESRLLLRQLQLKFGDLPDAVRRRVETADEDSLLRWSERVLTVEALDTLFD
ncbi:MAG: hypothetical protein KDH88_15275 [Chromatiales bacterium]|nr:hypothetical protein [Chromatiales bacterium]